MIAKLSSIHPYDSYTLKTITKKLVLLLALATGQQAQTLSLLRLSQIVINDEKLILRIPDRIKTSAPGRAQPFFCFSCFKNHENFCITHLTEEYIKRTRDLQPSGCDSFFISWNKPHKASTAQTISHWMRQGLGDCGIDTSIFTAHSTRYASTSKAASLDLIKRAAGWTGESHFRKTFYNRPIINPEDFCNAVLFS